MNTPSAEEMLRYAKKVGRVAFFQWLHNNHQFDYLMKFVRELDKKEKKHVPLFA